MSGSTFDSSSLLCFVVICLLVALSGFSRFSYVYGLFLEKVFGNKEKKALKKGLNVHLCRFS